MISKQMEKEYIPCQLVSTIGYGNPVERERAFGVVYGIFYDPLVRYAYGILKNREHAEDIVQQVLGIKLLGEA
ncbi:MAG: hypothetical protein AABX98_01185, partial [Nanoarchaeota archaeon]